MHRIAPLGLTLALVLGTAGPSPAQQGGIPLEPCGPDGAEREVLCGTLDVPENYAEPAGRAITLHLTVVKARAPRAGAAPLVVLPGGPGLAATGGAGYLLGPGRAFRQVRDVLLVDQRGTGQSAPLRCPDLERRSPLDELYPSDLVEACRRTLATTADLTQYTTANSARDLERVRAALGYEMLDLEGVSYGTELARAYLRLYPERVRAAVLIGPPSDDMRTPLPHAANAQRALDLLFHECQTDARCNLAYPDLRAEWIEVLDRVTRGVSVARRDPASGAATDVQIRRGPFAEAFRGLLTTAAQRRSLPFMIHRAAEGDFAPFVEALPPDGSAFAEGLYLSIACLEGTTRIDLQEVDRFTAGTFLGDYRVRRQIEACRIWSPGASAPDVEPTRATTRPVVVISGEFDQTTPPAYAREVCRALENCRLIEIPAMGHGPFDMGDWTGGTCVDRIVLDFFERGETDGVNASCVGQMAPPPFRLDGRAGRE